MLCYRWNYSPLEAELAKQVTTIYKEKQSVSDLTSSRITSSDHAGNKYHCNQEAECQKISYDMNTLLSLVHRTQNIRQGKCDESYRRTLAWNNSFNNLISWILIKFIIFIFIRPLTKIHSLNVQLDFCGYTTRKLCVWRRLSGNTLWTHILGARWGLWLAEWGRRAYCITVVRPVWPQTRACL